MEQLRVLVAGAAGALLGATTVDAPPLATGILALLSADAAGGLVALLNDSGKAWWHRPGRGPLAHGLFVAAHAVPITLFVTLFRAGDPRELGLSLLLLAAGAATILAASPRRQRAVALAVLFVVLIVLQQAFGTVREAAWFMPLLYAKLFVAYLPAPRPAETA
ncbi:MAG: hypothetical protein V2I63_04255 [Pseudomonadales bacterium]|jgi:hypothetical protein|nr:hypothetical protein [Pseudomonadales bacterium]